MITLSSFLMKTVSVAITQLLEKAVSSGVVLNIVARECSTTMAAAKFS
jgi:hypothetical protein